MRRLPPWAPGVVSAGLAFGVYLSTLAPGLFPSIDTPKFQFVGRVLGIPHQPGYPLYVLVSHAFSWLPVGTLAFRINLMSAVFAALAVGLAADALRRLGTPAVVSAGAALASGLGAITWSQSVVAEVYSLELALLAGIVVALAAWERTRRPAPFYAAAALLALSLGHHTTIVLFVPAMAGFVLLVDRRFVAEPRRLALVGLLLALGLSQYAFVLLRTAQGAVFNQAPARDLRELLDVVSARQFQGALFAFDARAVFERRVPLIASLLRAELGLPGLALAGAGLAWLGRRRPPWLLLLGGGAAGYVFFTLNYNVIDPHVFLVPAFPLLWLAAGAALGWLGRWRGRAGAGAALATAAAIALPASLYISNRTACDRSYDSTASRYFDAIFRRLPAGAAFVTEDFIVDQMVQYKVLGERVTSASILSTRPEAAEGAYRSGAPVFAFERASSRLDLEGLGFARQTVRPPSLAQYLRHLAPGTIAVLALPSLRSAPVTAPVGRLLEGLGDPEPVAERLLLNGAVIGVAGGGRPEERFDPAVASCRVERGGAIGDTGARAPVALSATSARDRTEITVDGQHVVRATGVAALVLLSPGGTVLERHLLAPGGSLAPAFSRDVPPLFRMLAARDCSAETDWSDQTGRADNGRLLVRLARGTRAVLYVAAQQPLAPAILRETERSVSRADVRDLSGAGGPQRREIMEADGLDRPPLSSTPYLYRVEVTRQTPEPDTVAIVLALGGIPEEVRIGPPAGAAPIGVCRHRGIQGPAFAEAGVSWQEVGLSNADVDGLGRGWDPKAQGDRAGAFRWLTGEAVLLLDLDGPRPTQLRLEMRPGEGADSIVGVSVNGTRLADQPMATGWAAYEWTVPARAWKNGTNQLAITVRPAAGTGPSRAAVRWIRLGGVTPGETGESRP